MMAERDKNQLIEITTNGLLPYEFTFIPQQFMRQWFNPDLQHTISLISGYDGEHEHIAVVDSTGALKINSAASGYLHYNVVSGTYDSTTPSAANVIFDDYVDELDLTVKDNPVNIRLTDSTTGQVGGIFELPVGYTQIKYLTNAVMIWCNVSGSSSTVQIAGWW